MTKLIRSKEKLAITVQEFGFLPLFPGAIPGFSVEDYTAPEYWFAADRDGPWEWKGPVITATGCAYGRFFGGKAGFITKEWFCDFANYRRDGYDLDARYEDGLLRRSDKAVYDMLAEHPSLISREWHRLTGIQKRGEFDAIVTRLQMLGYVTTVDFEYQVNRKGEIYGLALARYATPEQHFGADFTDSVYTRSPEESYNRMLEHLAAKLPYATEKMLQKLIG